MGKGETDATHCDKQVNAEKLTVPVDLFVYIILDGMANTGAQMTARTRYREHTTLRKDGVSTRTGQSVFEYTNPNAIPSDNDLDDALHQHLELSFDLSNTTNPSFTLYRRVSRQIKKKIENTAMKFYLRDDVSEIRVHAFVLLFNQGPIVFNLLASTKSEDELEVNEKIAKIFAGDVFLNNPKISYKRVEYIACVDLIGNTTDVSPQSAGFANGTIDYKDIISEGNDVIDKNIPSKQDIKDAIILCQHTYDSQSAIEKSVWDAASKEIDAAKTLAIDITKGLYNLGNRDVKDLAKEMLESCNYYTICNAGRYLLECMNPSSPSIQLAEFGGIPVGIPLEVLTNFMEYIVKNGKEASNTEKKQSAIKNQSVSIEVKKTEENTKKQFSSDGKISPLSEKEQEIERFTCDWRVVSTSEIEQDLLDGDSIWLKNYVTGFYSKLYKKIGENKYAFCTCGTNFSSPVDWIFTNLLQFFTGISPQHTQSVHVAKRIDKAIRKRSGILFFIGHSLGGGLASNNALATKDRHAITFNAAGLNIARVVGSLFINNTSDLFHPKRRKQRIHAFVLEDEILNFISKPLGQKAYGTVTASKISAQNNNLKDLKGKMAKHALTNFLWLKEEELMNVKKGDSNG